MSDAHVVTWPGSGAHVLLRVGDVELLPMNTLVAARRQKRVVVYEPLAPPSVCPKCSAAYAEARRVIEEAGGLAA